MVQKQTLHPADVFLRDCLMWLGQEELAVLVYKTVLRGPKNQQHLLARYGIMRPSFNIEKERLEYLFNQFPASPQKSAAGKQVSERHRTAFGQNEGRNIKHILAAAKGTSVAGKTQNIASLMNDPEQLYVLAFGASWCGHAATRTVAASAYPSPAVLSSFSRCSLRALPSRREREE